MIVSTTGSRGTGGSGAARARAVRLSAALAVGGMLMAACGGSSSTSGDPSDASGGPAPTSAESSSPGAEPGPATSATPGTKAPAGESPLPEVDVLDVATGDTVQFAGLLPADRALLFWFWAPH